MSDPLDVARYVFINDENELRSGWRVLIFVFCFVIVAALLTGLTMAFAALFPSLDYLRREELALLAGSNLGNLAAALIASAICAGVLERRRLGSVGFKLHRSWLKDFALGSLMGAASLAIAVGIAAGVGSLSFDVQTRGFGALARGFVITSFFFVVAGATEELIFRGFPFQALVHNLGGPGAVAISSLIFGLAHLSNPGASIFSTTNTILAGVWLGLAYLMTRSLWLATALHWSWNFAMVFIFGLPVSGLTTLGEMAWLKGRIAEPVWISGGNYGPEAGMAATIALILSTLAIWKSGMFTTSVEMQLAIAHGKPEPARLSITPAPGSLPEENRDNQSHHTEVR
jgi:membrane protease YdiL (CAAX protease family)